MYLHFTPETPLPLPDAQPFLPHHPQVPVIYKMSSWDQGLPWLRLSVIGNIMAQTSEINSAINKHQKLEEYFALSPMPLSNNNLSRASLSDMLSCLCR